MITEGKYINKKWLIPPEYFPELIKRLKYVLVGHLAGSEDYVLERKSKPGTFYLFHISWGNYNKVEKYKLFRYSWE